MKFALHEKGQNLMDYIVVLILVAVVVIATVTIIGPLVGAPFSTISSG